MEDEEFVEAINSSDGEYYDSETYDINEESQDSWIGNTQHSNIVSYCLEQKHVQSCSKFINESGHQFYDKYSTDTEELEKNNEISKNCILEAILNEESLRKIYFEDECIPNSPQDCTANVETENKMNLWSYINNLPSNVTTSREYDNFSEDDSNLNTIKEVQELEMEIEQMFNTPIAPIPEVPPVQEDSSGEVSNGIFYSPISSKRKISPLPSYKYIETNSNTLEMSGLSEINNPTSDESEKEKFLQLKSIPSIASLSSMDQDLASGTDSEEIVTLMKKDSSGVHPIHSIEIIPKLIEKRKEDNIEIVENLLRANTILESTNFFEKETKINTRKKKSKAVIPQEFKKVRSYVVNTGSSKKVQKNSSKSFHFDRCSHNKISTSDRSRLKLDVKTNTKTQLQEKKKTESKKNKAETSKSKRNSRAINTTRITKRNFCCQKIGAFIESTNFCSISLTLEPVDANVGKEELTSSLKDYFWSAGSNKERALIQFVVLCMENNFKEIAITNEKFKLYCQNEFSTFSITENKDSFKSNLICQPLYIETILSQSHVNRLDFESKGSSVQDTSDRTVEKTETALQEEEKSLDDI